METQQFHLKWNNHSLNTLSSFQHLLDTNTLVDVSLTCSNGKTVTAHRMVLAACSDYFYRYVVSSFHYLKYESKFY